MGSEAGDGCLLTMFVVIAVLLIAIVIRLDDLQRTARQILEALQ